MSGPTSPKRRRLRQNPAKTKLFEAQSASVYGRLGSFNEATALEARAQTAAAAAAAAKLPETVDLSGAEGEAGGSAALMGARVKVYWADNSSWFTGVVDIYNAALGYHVSYADGDKKWHQLLRPGEERWNFLPAHGGNAGRSQHDAGARLLGGAAPAPPVPPAPRAPRAPPVPRTPPASPAPPAAYSWPLGEAWRTPERTAPKRKARCAPPPCVTVRDKARKLFYPKGAIPLLYKVLESVPDDVSLSPLDGFGTSTPVLPELGLRTEYAMRCPPHRASHEFFKHELPPLEPHVLFF